MYALALIGAQTLYLVFPVGISVALFCAAMLLLTPYKRKKAERRK